MFSDRVLKIPCDGADMFCGHQRMADDDVASFTSGPEISDVEDRAATDPYKDPAATIVGLLKVLVKCQDGGAEADSGRRRIGGIAASALWLSQVWERHLPFVRPPLTLASP